MLKNIKVKEIECQSAIGKCGFPGGGLAINPYVGCEHACVYCYARFIKRFTNHKEEWGSFVDCRINIADILAKQMKSPKFQNQRIYLGTVTDPYQPIENKYQLTRKILEILKNYNNPVSILTKSALVLRDLDLLKKFKNIDVDFTIDTLDEDWRKLTEPFASTIKGRFEAMRKLVKEGILVMAMIGPYWPVFTDAKEMFKKFKEIGVSHVFIESFNAVGGNWTGVEEVLKKDYPQILPKIKEIIFNKEKFDEFYQQVREELLKLSKDYKIPVTIYFGQGHAASKFAITGK